MNRLQGGLPFGQESPAPHCCPETIRMIPSHPFSLPRFSQGQEAQAPTSCPPLTYTTELKRREAFPAAAAQTAA